MTNCISCNTVSGDFQPPGGIVYENAYWLIALRKNPLRSPCYAFIILKRHCEHVRELTNEEAASLGETMRLTAQVMDTVLQPAKVHFGLYAEDVKHIHVHVFPRMPNMVAGNVPHVYIGIMLRILNRLGLKKAYPDEEVAVIAEQLRDGFRKTVGDADET